MKLLIAIPSKNRALTLFQNALRWVEKTGIDYAVFIEPQDKERYEIIRAKNVVFLAENDQGLGYAKQQIKEYALKNNYTHVFKVDDDVRGFTNYRNRLKEPEEIAKHVNKILTDIERAFEKYPQIKAVGFPYSFEMYDKKVWEVTKRLQTSYVVKTEDWYVNPKVSTFEDMATGISIIAKGGLLMRYCMAGIDQGVKVGGGAGGCQSFDRAAQALVEVEEMRKIYPPLKFKKVDKPWKIEPDMSSVDIPKKA